MLAVTDVKPCAPSESVVNVLAVPEKQRPAAASAGPVVILLQAALFRVPANVVNAVFCVVTKHRANQKRHLQKKADPRHQIRIRNL